MGNYSNNRRSPRISTDKFGNPFQLKRAKQVKTKDGEMIEIYKAWVELGGKLYCIEVSNNNKDYPDGHESKWVKVTKKVRNTRQNSM